MSMWEIEAIVEDAVGFVAASALKVQDKRRLVVQLYDLQGLFDCSFTHFRCWEALLDLGVMSVLPVSAYPDPQQRAKAQALIDQGKRDWLMSEEGKGAAFVEAGPTPPGGLWVEPRMSLWATAVEEGLIQGLAAEPVPFDPQDLGPAIELLALAAAEPERATGTLVRGWSGFLLMLRMFGLGPDPRQDPRLEPALRSLAKAGLSEPVDWIPEKLPMDPQQLEGWGAPPEVVDLARWFGEL